MKRGLSFLLLVCLLASLLAGCAPAAPQTGDPAAPTVPAAPSEPVQPADPGPQTVKFTDSVGREVELPANITKIAVTGPIPQIALFALAPEMLVGVATEWDKAAQEYVPTEYYKLPVIGQLYGGKGDLNKEGLLAAAPDVVIDVGEPKKGIETDLDSLQEQTGIPFVHVTAYLDSMGDAYRLLGQLLPAKAEEAKTLADYCDRIYSNTQRIAKEIEGKKVNLLYCLGDKGINVIAQGSYHAAAMDLLSNNLAVVSEPAAKGTGNEVDMEQILLWNPDVIVFAPNSVYAGVGNDPVWKQVKAVKNGTYYEVPFGPYNWMGMPPSFQRVLGMMWMAQLLYPDVAKYDLKSEVTQYYKLFYHVDLTEAQYNTLVENSIGK